MKAPPYLYSLMLACVILSSCGNTNRPSETASDENEASTVIDTLLNGYSVRICMEAVRLKRGFPNELRIEVDSALGDGWHVFTKAREATIRIDTVSGKWHVLPTVSAESVSIFFSFTGHDGMRLEPGRVILFAE